jgi:hypothetical protein
MAAGTVDRYRQKIVKMAEDFPADKYDFKPTPDVVASPT